MTAGLPGRYPRKAKSGKDLRLPREVRTRLLCTGESINTKLSQAVPGFGIFTFTDIGSVHDISFFLLNKTDCCGAGKNDYFCTPNIIPDDDPVHRFSGIKCMNLTRPLDFQYWGCTNDPVPAPIEKGTSAFDLSNIYNNKDTDGTLIRLFKGGLLYTDVINGKVYPADGDSECFANSPGQRCFRDISNPLLSIQLISLWYMRQHNNFANALSKLNPCWDDDKLYFVARDINIAFAQQVHVYDWMATIIGKQNLIDSGVAAKDEGFRDIYDSKLYPAITLEFTATLRWFHVIQNGITKFYDTKGNYLKDYPIVNSTFRPGFLFEDDNLVEATLGFFKTEANNYHGVHPDIGERGLPNVQDVVDVPTSDLHKHRLFGIRPYVDYIKHFFGITISCFEDLSQFVDQDKILMLKRLYDDVSDIDLLAGVWCERNIKGGHIPPTLAAIVEDNLFKVMQGDRHWYESKKRPYSFTPEQLKEIRKATLSLLACTAGDGITAIQKNAFLNICPENPEVSCEEFPKIDLSKWIDHTCSNDCPVY